MRSPNHHYSIIEVLVYQGFLFPLVEPGALFCLKATSKNSGYSARNTRCQIFSNLYANRSYRVWKRGIHSKHLGPFCYWVWETHRVYHTQVIQGNPYREHLRSSSKSYTSLCFVESAFYLKTNNILLSSYTIQFMIGRMTAHANVLSLGLFSSPRVFR